jgi:hypothetical protein
MWQTAAYWFMGAMSNNPSKLAYFTGANTRLMFLVQPTRMFIFLTGFYKSIQSAGGAIGWRLDGIGKPYMTIFITTWVLLVAGLIFMLPMMHMRIHEHTEEAVYVPLIYLNFFVLWLILSYFRTTVKGTEQVTRLDKHTQGVRA